MYDDILSLRGLGQAAWNHAAIARGKYSHLLFMAYDERIQGTNVGGFIGICNL